MPASAFDTYRIAAIDLAGQLLRAGDNFSEDPQIELIRFRTSGRMAYSYTGTNRVMPIFTFQTPEIQLALNGTSMAPEGLAIDATPLVIYWVLQTEVGPDNTQALLTTHNKGIVTPTQLTGSDGAWMLTLQSNAIALDGLTDPVVYGTGSLPANAVVAESFIGGSFRFNGEATGDEVECWQDITLNFGNDPNFVPHQGLPYPTRAQNNSTEQTLDITNLDPNERTRLGLYGTRLTEAKLYLRKVQSAAGQVPNRVPDATAEHIRFDFFSGVGHLLGTTGSGTADVNQGVRFVFDETDADESMLMNFNVPIPGLTP